MKEKKLSFSDFTKTIKTNNTSLGILYVECCYLSREIEKSKKKKTSDEFKQAKSGFKFFGERLDFRMFINSMYPLFMMFLTIEQGKVFFLKNIDGKDTKECAQLLQKSEEEITTINGQVQETWKWFRATFIDKDERVKKIVK